MNTLQYAIIDPNQDCPTFLGYTDEVSKDAFEGALRDGYKNEGSRWLVEIDSDVNPWKSRMLAYVADGEFVMIQEPEWE